MAPQAGLISYNIHMTDDELWRDVGRFLRDQRESQGKTANQIATLAGIDSDTVRAIERGQTSRVDKLKRLVQALGLSIVDALNEGLKGDEARPTREVAALLRAWERLDVEDQGLVFLFVKRLVEQHEARTRAELATSDAPPPPATPRRKRKAPTPR